MLFKSLGRFSLYSNGHIRTSTQTDMVCKNEYRFSSFFFLTGSLKGPVYIVCGTLKLCDSVMLIQWCHNKRYVYRGGHLDILTSFLYRLAHQADFLGKIWLSNRFRFVQITTSNFDAIASFLKYILP